MGSTTLIRDAFPSNPTLRRKEKKDQGSNGFSLSFPKESTKRMALFALLKTVKENKKKKDKRGKEEEKRKEKKRKKEEKNQFGK